MRGLIVGIANAGYGIMGSMKAALRSTVRYLAHERGPQAIRVNLLSTLPVRTRAASGLSHLDDMIAAPAARAPLHQLATTEQISAMTAFLLSPDARTVTGPTIYVDSGFNISAG